MAVNPILDEKIGRLEPEALETFSRMIGIKSVSPESGGEGELKRVEYLESVVSKITKDVKRYDYRDSNGFVRPNLVAKYGECKKTVWIIAHTDTVSEGDLSLWKTDPYKAVVKEDRIYGRGSSDNGQGVISAIYAMKALKESGLRLKYNIGIALVADEELGSRYGICKVLNEDIFSKEDLLLVPDSGNKKGDVIEVAEKGILWVKITVKGKQVHASVPDHGVNAYRYASRLVLDIDEYLHRRYSEKNSLFEVQKSTFEMTRHEKNVDSVNIMPGTEVLYFDCRVLPQYTLDEVLNDIKKVASGSAYKDVKIDVEVFNREDSAPYTRSDSEVVTVLSSVLKTCRDIKPMIVGIGGGTCAALFRKKGFQAAVWSTHVEVAHEPNEYCILKNLFDDTKVFAQMCIQDD